MSRTLYYVHDPMCSWCWAFCPVWARIRAALPAGLSVRPLLGGLAPDSAQPMPQEMRARIEGIWRSIQITVPGTEFNFEFWTRNTPRRSTYPACRAVIAARRQGMGAEDAPADPMIRAIQRAYYLEARNPSDTETLVDLAGALGLDRGRFAADLQAPATQAALEQEIATAQRLGAHGLPSLVLEDGGRHRLLTIDYRDERVVLQQLRQL